jgi:thiol-disulfide isomerase/thioredoxin
MTFSRIAAKGILVWAALSLFQAAMSQARAQNQDEPAVKKPTEKRPGPAGMTIQSINEDYNSQLLQIERTRLERLAQLARTQQPKEAGETYEMLFRLALANNLFREAEPVADQVLKSTSNSPAVSFLAHTLNIIAEADRGAYEESLADLGKAVGQKVEGREGSPASSPILDTPALLAICEAYYQRLLQGDQFDVARKAFRLIINEAENTAVKGYCSGRLNQLDMIGKSAPAIEGTDLDGKPVSLSALKGNVVLVVFWASWCLPSSTEIAWLDNVYDKYRDKGFRILGINVDVFSGGAVPPESLVPNIKRFLLDHNVRWPNLINGADERDYAKHYGVADIPANFLIGPDGTIVHLDLGRKNFATVIAKAVAR